MRIPLPRVVKRKFKDLPIFAKISVIVYTLVIMFCITLLVVPLLLYRTTEQAQQHDRSLYAIANATATFNTQYQQMMERFVSIFGTQEFAAIVKETKSANSKHDITSEMQSYIQDLSNANYLIDDVVILSSYSKDIYKLYNTHIYGTRDDIFTSDDLKAITGITWFPERRSLSNSRSKDIVLVVPLILDKYDYVKVSGIGDFSDCYVIICLNTDRLLTALNSSNLGSDVNSFSLVNRDGVYLTGDEMIRHSYMDVVDELTVNINNDQKSTHYIQNDNEVFYAHMLHMNCGYLVYHVELPNPTDLSWIDPKAIVTLMVFATVVMMAIAFLLRHFITSPIDNLVSVVNQIGEGRYDHKQSFVSKDEVGQLGTAINSMYDTIQEQIDTIKEEESEKYLAQIRLMTEQINPHFLYNTLDAIQTEINAGSNDNAASMLQYLAQYLRISLSYGDDFITIANEIKHANAYVNLMNQRFHKSIMFINQFDPSLADHMILKTILQPLLENSIRHGFGIDATGMPIGIPTIEVKIWQVGDALDIEVSDNGSGFDVARTTKILYEDADGTSKRHVGLHNVYHRLTIFYGEENVHFELSSVPYYKNTIKISIAQIQSLT